MFKNLNCAIGLINSDNLVIWIEKKISSIIIKKLECPHIFKFIRVKMI